MILVADNLQITNHLVEQAVAESRENDIIHLVRECEKKGADAIDINSGPLGRDAARKMTFLVEAVQKATPLPILIDTANPTAMKAGLAACRQPAIINGVSLEPRKVDQILPLAKTYKADIIGYLLYPDSHVPSNADERLAIAAQLLETVEKHGVDRRQLIIDPVVVPLSWDHGKSQAFEILEVIRLLPELFGFPVRTIAGLSNLTSGGSPFAKRMLMEKAYVPMLASAGLTMILLNILHKETVKVAKACRLLKDETVFSWGAI